MTTIDKLLIKGIRSFEPENSRIIVFYRPLTLIVGDNGAGKTTIIECLKQACTGELPPNSRSGHSFVHDPKVNCETETMGEIKLQFKTAAGRDAIITRSFKLTQMGKKMEYKSLESTLQTIDPNTGKPTRSSCRSADMDKEIPALMGVSEAILKNVIFLHQADSNWPFQDPSTLKRKFDDIFSITRYSKALEEIRKVNEQLEQDIRKNKEESKDLQTQKDAANKLRDSICEEQEKSKTLKEQIKDLVRKIQATEGKISDIENSLKELQKLEDQIPMFTCQKTLKYTQYEELRLKLEGVNEVLRSVQPESEEWTAILQSEMSRLESEINDEEAKGVKLSKKREKSMEKIQELKNENKIHSEMVNQRAVRIHNILKKENLDFVLEPSLRDAEAITQFLKRIKIKIKKDLQDKKESNEMELNNLVEQYTKVNTKCIVAESNKQSKIQTRADIIKEIEAKEKEIAEHELDCINLPYIYEKEKKLKVMLEQRTNALASMNFESTIPCKKEELESSMKKVNQPPKEIESTVCTDEWKRMESKLKRVTKRYQSAREEKLKARNIKKRLKKAQEALMSLSKAKCQVDLDEEHLGQDIDPLLMEKEKLMLEHRELKIKLDREYGELEKRQRSFLLEHDAVQALSSKIKEYIDSGKQEMLHDLQEKVVNYQCRLEKCESRKKELSSELSRSKKLLCDQREYLIVKKEVENLAHEIDMLEDKKSSIGRMPAFETDLGRQKKKWGKLIAKLNRRRGSRNSTHKHNISKLKEELAQSKYTDIDKRFYENQIELILKERANRDLDRYYNAVDRAILQHHSVKLEELNKIIKELWQRTYRGADIDYISILSGSEGAGTRSDGYRVVMQTGFAELEMRGRCSAGQKVLASIIIRLALAEMFCLNFGVLALDEPTTNLDEPNATSLATSLSRIIEDRSGQENFQLIVITHDERFANLIGSKHAQRYYSVKKDENQHSMIKVKIFN